MEQNEIMLDDFLRDMDQARKDYRLSEPKIGLNEILENEHTHALRKLLECLIKRSGSKISSTSHPLLSVVSPDVYGEEITSSFEQRFLINSNYAQFVLQKMIERALQTIVQLPAKDENLDTTRELKKLALNFQKLAEKASQTLQKLPIINRIHEYFRGSHESGRDDLYHFPEQMQVIAERIISIYSRTKPVKNTSDSPKPQIRFALTFVDWVRKFAGGPHYVEIENLIQSAFTAAKGTYPRWTGRLAREMNSKRRRRKDLARQLMGIQSRKSPN